MQDIKYELIQGMLLGWHLVLATGSVIYSFSIMNEVFSGYRPIGLELVLLVLALVIFVLSVSISGLIIYNLIREQPNIYLNLGSTLMLSAMAGLLILLSVSWLTVLLMYDLAAPSVFDRQLISSAGLITQLGILVWSVFHMVGSGFYVWGFRQNWRSE